MSKQEKFNEKFVDIKAGEKYHLISKEDDKQKGDFVYGVYFVNSLSKDKGMIIVTKNNTDIFFGGEPVYIFRKKDVEIYPENINSIWKEQIMDDKEMENIIKDTIQVTKGIASLAVLKQTLGCIALHDLNACKLDEKTGGYKISDCKFFMENGEFCMEYKKHKHFISIRSEYNFEE